MKDSGIAASFLNSALDGGERSISQPGRFTQVKLLRTHWIGGWRAQDSVWMLWNREKSLALAEN
jgi:hypothetical protein